MYVCMYLCYPCRCNQHTRGTMEEVYGNLKKKRVFGRRGRGRGRGRGRPALKADGTPSVEMLLAHNG
jgi:hypothetical protein